MGQLKKEKFIATPLSKWRPAKCLLIIFCHFCRGWPTKYFLVMVDKNGVSSRPIKIIISCNKDHVQQRARRGLSASVANFIALFRGNLSTPTTKERSSLERTLNIKKLKDNVSNQTLCRNTSALESRSKDMTQKRTRSHKKWIEILDCFKFRRNNSVYMFFSFWGHTLMRI